MRKHEFLKELLYSLSEVPEAERDKAYSFYAEIIDDSMEDGMAEEEAVAKLGSMDEIVERIVSEIPMSVLLKSRVRRKNRGTIAVLLAVLGFPVWFPIVMTAVTLILTLFIVVWALDLAAWVTFASTAAAAVASCAGVFYFPEIGARLMCLGGALAGLGFAVPLYLAALAVTRQFARFTGMLWKKMKNSLIRKRGNEQ